MLGPYFVRPLLLLLPLVAVACAEEPETSPFALWDHRIGMPLSQLDSITLHDMGRRFTCVPVHDFYERCAVDAEGIPGQMRVVLDSLDRAVEFVFEPDILAMQGSHANRLLGAAGEVRREWDRAAPAEQTNEDGLRTRSWSAGAGRWTAEIRWFGNLPSLIRTTDERAITGYRYAESLAPSSPAPSSPVSEEQAPPERASSEPARASDPLGPMRRTLQQLLTAQELHYSMTDYRYADSAGEIDGWRPEPNVTVEILEADDLGWSAVATDPVAEGRCAVFLGRAAPPPPATVQGRVACEEG